MLARSSDPGRDDMLGDRRWDILELRPGEYRAGAWREVGHHLPEIGGRTIVLESRGGVSGLSGSKRTIAMSSCPRRWLRAAKVGAKVRWYEQRAPERILAMNEGIQGSS